MVRCGSDPAADSEGAYLPLASASRADPVAGGRHPAAEPEQEPAWGSGCERFAEMVSGALQM